MYNNIFLSFSDLQDLFKERYTPAPVPVLLEEIFDVREWLKAVNQGYFSGAGGNRGGGIPPKKFVIPIQI